MTRSRRCLACMFFSLLLAASAACGPGEDPLADAGASEQDPPVARIGPQGGEVEEDGAKITVPAGALESDEPITITIADVDLPPTWQQLTPVYRFRPEGLQFATPVTVALEINDVDLDDVSVLWSGDDGASWEALETARGDGVVSADVQHFSLGVAARPHEGVDSGPIEEEDAGPIVEEDAGPIVEDDAGPSDEDDAGPSDQEDAGGDAGACVPLTCGAVACGGMEDGCGGVLHCGTCTAPATCGGGGVGGACGCTPTTCEDVGATCGTLEDGCGAPLECGPCSGSETCGGGGHALRCGAPACVGGWCWQSPSPAGGNYYAVHGSSASDVWAVGLQGSALHWDGGDWHELGLATEQTLLAVYARAADDVWAAGTGGVVMHWDGAVWSEHETPTTGVLWGVYAAAADDVWAVGDEGLLHYDGVAWTSALSGVQLFAIWGSSADAIWAVGLGGVIAKFDGSSWSPVTTTIAEDLYAVAGSGTADVFAAGDGATYHFDGSTWAQVVNRGAAAIAVDAAGTFYAGLYTVWRWDGAQQGKSLGSLDGQIWGAYSAPTGELFFVGGPGESVSRFDGARWHLPSVRISDFTATNLWTGPTGEPVLIGRFPSTLYPSASFQMERRGGHWSALELPFVPEDAWVNAWNDVWAVGRRDNVGSDGVVAHFDGSAWSVVVDDVPGSLTAVWGTSASDLWMAGRHGFDLFHFDGASVMSVDRPDVSANAMWGAAPDDVWIVGTIIGDDPESFLPAAAHFDGTTWTKHDITLTDSASASDPRLVAVWGSGPADVWAVGQSGYYASAGPLLVHFDGSEWSEVSLPTPATEDWYGLAAIWGSGPSDIWTGGAPLLHFDGSAWSVVDDALSAGVIAGSGPDRVFVGGYSGLSEWDGALLASTTEVGTAPIRDPITAWASSADQVWVGQYSGVARWDGARWGTIDLGRLTSLSGTSPTDVWAADDYDAIVHHWNGDAWSPRTSGLTGGSGVTGVHALSPNAAWASTSHGLFRWNGFAWSHVAGIDTGVSDLRDVWASAATDVWAVKADAIYRGDGATFSVVHPSSNAYYRFIEGTGPDDVWAFGTAVSHWDGAQWTGWTLPGSVVAAVVVGVDDVWISHPATAGGAPRIASHWDGATWTSAFMPMPEGVKAFAAAEGVVWAFGTFGQVMRLSP